MERTLALPMTLATVLAAGWARADEVRLLDGRVLVGKVSETKAGTVLQIETRRGTVKVDRDQVAGIRTDDTLRAALEQLERGRQPTPFGDLNLATSAWQYGLSAEMWTYLDRALAGLEKQRRGAPSNTAALRGRMREFAGSLESEFLAERWREAAPARRVKLLLDKVRAGLTPARQLAIVEILAREPQADDALRTLARSSSSHGRRLTALEALQRRHQTTGNEQFVYRTAILDGSSAVRFHVMEMVQRERGAAAALDYLTPGLGHSAPIVRIRTAEAFGALRERNAVESLIAAGPVAGKALASSGGSAPTRGNVAFVDQTSFVRDFNVEVASASFIADPKIDVLQSGAVSDVSVHSTGIVRTQIVRAYRNAIRRIVGEDPGAKPKEWAAWWEARRTPPAGPTTGRNNGEAK